MQLNTNIELMEIFESNEISDILTHFYNATNLYVKCCNLDGDIISYPKNSTPPKFCEVIRGNKEGCERCRKSIKYGCSKSFDLGEPYIYACHLGTIVCTAPIILNEKLVGSITLGPVLLWEMDENAIEEFEEKSKNLDIDMKTLILSAHDLTQLACTNLTSAAHLLQLIVNALASSRSELMQERSKINKQQARIAELIMEKKKYEKAEEMIKRKQTKNISLKKEKELISRVTAGDDVGARNILNVILSEVFYDLSGNVDNINARIIELMAVLSRAAVEGGAPIEKLNEIMQSFMNGMKQEKTFENMCVLATIALENFMKTVFEYRNLSATSQYLSSAVEFIKAHYMDEISLDKVANKVFISSFYLSHIFREEMDVTFSDYVTKVRLEESKKLLLSTNYKIASVAEKVGYFDANYFTKAFKKMYGIGPKDFRVVSK